MALDVRKELRLDELRSGFLEYTRGAYELLPELTGPRILDIGCGRGTSMLELARVCDGTFVGIDIDDDALASLREVIERDGMSDRMTTLRSSLIGVELPEGSFDIAWEEGVLHLLDLPASLKEIGRLLRPGGFLVSCETVESFERHREGLRDAGFEVIDSLRWRKGCWWTDYYEPLERRIRQLRASQASPSVLEALERYEAEVEMVKRDPERWDCGHFVMRRK